MKTIIASTPRGSSDLRRRMLRIRPPATLPVLAVLFTAVCLSTQLSAGIVFDNGFEGGEAEWGASGPWSPTPANAPVSSSTISREGAKSVRFQPTPGNKRSEFTIKNGFGDYDWGTEYWVGFSVRIIQPNDGFGHIIQHHSKPRQGANGQPDWTYVSGENSFTLDATSEGFTVLTATDPSKVNGETAHGHVRTQPGSSSWGTVATGPIPYELNRWYDFVLHFRLATNSTGIMEVWMKDTVTGATNKLVNVTAGVTVYAYDSGKIQAANPAEWVDGQPKTPRNEQKIGLYYGADFVAVGGDILIDAFRIWEGPGGSYEAVAPGAGTPPPSPPAAPTGLTATPVSSSQINLNWNPVTPTPLGYRVYRGATSGTVTSNVSGDLGPSVTTFNNTGLTASTTYYYAARAFNPAGESGNSNIVGAITLAGGGGGTPGIYEAETLPAATNLAPTAISTFTEAGASPNPPNGANSLFVGAAVGDFITYTINVPVAGTYNVIANGVKYTSRARCRLYVNGSATPLGAEMNLHHSLAGVYAYQEFDQGNVTLNAGNNTFKFQISAQGAGGGWKLSFDYIKLTPQGGANTPPVAVADGYTVAEGGTLNIAAPGVLANDTDADSDPLTVAAPRPVTGPAHGTLTLDANGSFTYTHDGSETTTDSFTYKASDGTADSNAATVTLTITPVNDTPIANPQNVSTNEDTAVGITLTGSDPENSPLSYTVTANPSHGTLTGTAPDLTYTPAADYNGSDSFTFKVNDGTVDSAPAIVSITVNPAGGGTPIVIDFNDITGATTSQDDSVGSIGLTGASGNDAVRFLADGPSGDWVQFSIPPGTIPAGTYAVSVRVRKANSMGKYQMSIDGANQGTEQNLYSSSGTFAVLDLGTTQITGNNNRLFKFTCAGKDSASSNYTLTLDTLTLTP